VVIYRTVEVVEHAGHGDNDVITGEFDSEEQAVGQALALHNARGGHLRVERVETRTLRTMGKLSAPRIIAPGSPYYATSPRGDGIYQLRSEHGPLPETILFTFRRQARVIMQALTEASDQSRIPF